jgi:hypothetical protein
MFTKSFGDISGHYNRRTTINITNCTKQQTLHLCSNRGHLSSWISCIAAFRRTSHCGMPRRRLMQAVLRKCTVTVRLHNQAPHPSPMDPPTLCRPGACHFVTVMPEEYFIARDTAIVESLWLRNITRHHTISTVEHLGDRVKSLAEISPLSLLKNIRFHLLIFQGEKKTPWSESARELYRPRDRRVSAKWLPTFADRGCHVVSVTDPYGRILGFLDRSRYFSIK